MKASTPRARLDALDFQRLVRGDAQRHFAARREQEDIGLLAVGCVGKRVSAAAHAFGGCVLLAVEGWHRLARHDDAGRQRILPPAAGSRHAGIALREWRNATSELCR